MKKLLLLVSVMVTIFGAYFEYPDYHHLWEMVTAIATVWIIYTAYYQLCESNQTSKATFIRNFSDNFFNPETRDLIMLLDMDALDFKIHKIEYGVDDPTNKDCPYFEIDSRVLDQLQIPEKKKEGLTQRKVYSSYEIDDLVIGYFEDLGAFEKKGLVDIREVYNHFDWYVQMVWENTEIQKYIASQRDNEKSGDDIDENFEYIAKRLKSYGKMKSENKCFWLWKTKR